MKRCCQALRMSTASLLVAAPTRIYHLHFQPVGWRCHPKWNSQPSIGRFETNTLPQSGHLSINAGRVSCRRHCACPKVGSPLARRRTGLCHGQVGATFHQTFERWSRLRLVSARHPTSSKLPDAPHNRHVRFDHKSGQRECRLLYGLQQNTSLRKC